MNEVVESVLLGTSAVSMLGEIVGFEVIGKLVRKDGVTLGTLEGGNVGDLIGEKLGRKDGVALGTLEGGSVGD